MRDDDKIVIERFPKIDYVLVHWPSNKVTPWVAAFGYYEDSNSWHQGHYFRNILDACEYIKGVMERRS